MKNLLDSRIWKKLSAMLLLTLIFLGFVKAQIAVGGSYKLTQSSVANGGGASANGIYTVEGTIGQIAAGTTQQNSPFAYQTGFWTAQVFAPTAASVILGGRVTTANGRGIRNARVALTMPDGTTRYVVSGALGYYRFADVPAGETYILTASAKRFVFTVPTQVVSLAEDREDVDFNADEGFRR